MLKGYIAAKESDRQELEQLGVILGEYRSLEQDFSDCIVDEKAFNLLDPLWGKYYWSLDWIE
ncbi:hypothetical protein [Paenibacillus silvae]|uniref:Uncharacterized protein n=1 Tax=Paenibacillus silvae TaxID=1325358 RepID=A0A2W6NNS2_9BACL|nr:hypothetical protein [Paenibacillus silvae]PZT57415.1 hypothetical protein DN757_01800 [Paenibacillus silvae]